MRGLKSQLFSFALILLALQACGQRAGDLHYVKITQGTNLSIAVNPQEQYIIHDLQGALYRIDIDGGTSIPITGYYMDARQPSISADGSTVYFQSYQDGN